ncbi:hypothetical protein H9Q70_009557 [Fusarium xylarioides]|nr:hypothetical protein H9Q70_009557 [Fusarium xylarioides]KAG5775060.1 hypothetical protein H9Q73_011263 [Fusarium xylarioides]
MDTEFDDFDEFFDYDDLFETCEEAYFALQRAQTICAEHNHDPSDEGLSVARLRRQSHIAFGLTRLHELVGTLSHSRKNTLKDIARQISVAHPEVKILEQDVRVMRKKLRREAYGAFTSTQAFLNVLEHDDDIAFHSIDRAPNQKIWRIFWIYKKSIDKWKRNLDLLVMDNTYKVNRFNMPLLQITRITALHTNFSVAFGVAAKEDEEAFTWLLEQLDNVRQQHQIPHPRVIVSDFDDAFKSAVRRVFYTSQQQLCLWHMKKNVNLHISQKWLHYAPPVIPISAGEAINASQQQGHASDNAFSASSAPALPSASQILSDTLCSHIKRRFEDSRDGIEAAFIEMCEATTEADFNRVWGDLQRDFAYQHASQRTESSHRDLKVYLANRFCDLYELNVQIRAMIRDREQHYAVEFEKQLSKRREPYEAYDQMRLLIHRVSYIAMDHLVEQIELAKRALDPRDDFQLSRCTKAFTAQWGLPCCHKIFLLVQEGGFLQLKDLSYHWWLKADTPEQQQKLNERYEPDPDIVEAFRRRRPQNEAIAMPDTAPSGREWTNSEFNDLQQRALAGEKMPGKKPASQGKKPQKKATAKNQLALLTERVSELQGALVQALSRSQQPVIASQPYLPQASQSQATAFGANYTQNRSLPPILMHHASQQPRPVMPSLSQPPPSAQVPGSYWCPPQQVTFTGHLQYGGAFNSHNTYDFSGSLPNSSQAPF